MRIFSKGDLYIGRDDESFYDIQIHFGNYRLEWEWNPKSHESQPITEEAD